jgi:hypothetical protein
MHLRFATLACAGLLLAAAPPAAPPAAAPTYADLADLADSSDIVAHVRVKDAILVPPERAGMVSPGFARVYVEAQTVALLAGRTGLGESVRYLADVPLAANGKPAKLKKREFLVFARPVAGRPGEIQLAGRNAQLAWDPALEARVRPVLAALAAAGAPPAITGVRDALAVPGTLTGESETQIFLSTRAGDPVSVTVARRPGMAPAWGVSLGEIVDQAAAPPAPDTLGWYRLACSLPPQLPPAANLASDPAARALAVADYQFVLRQLGPCTRTFAN